MGIFLTLYKFGVVKSCKETASSDKMVWNGKEILNYTFEPIFQIFRTKVFSYK